MYHLQRNEMYRLGDNAPKSYVVHRRLTPNLDCLISMRSRVPMAVITKLLKLTKKVSAILSFAMVAISAVLLFLTIRFLH